MYYIWLVCDNHCKDVYLPDHPNWNGEIALGQNDTGWKTDIKIPIRCLDNNWFISCASGFSWKDQKTKRGEIKIHDQLAVVMQKDQHSIGILFSYYDIRNTVFKKYLLPSNTRIEIGRDPNCAICFSDQTVSHVHGTMEIKGNACVYTDNSRLGSYLNGIRLNGYYQLRFGDVITLSSGIKIIYLQDIIAINCMMKAAHIRLTPAKLTAAPPKKEDGEEEKSLITYHHRMIRIVEPADTEPVAIEPPPSKSERKDQPMWMTLGPSMTMILPMAMGVLASGRSASGLVMIGTSSVLAVFWGLMGAKYRKKDVVVTEQKRIDLYKKYIAEIDQELHELYDKELNRLMLHNPDVGQCALFPAENRRRLWERMPSHPDFLHVRLGKGGVPLPSEITTQEQRLSLVDDPLRDEPQKLIDAYGVIQNAPITVPLREHPMIGILGEETAVSFAQGLVLQLSVLHSYHDVRICILTEESQKTEWEWARWIPHVFASEDRQLRMVVSTPGSRQDVLSHLDEVLGMRIASYEEKAGSNADETPESILPHYIVFCTNPELLENKPLLKSVLSFPLGFTVVLLAKSPEMLPKECNLLLDIEGGNLLKTDGSRTKVDYEYPHNELLRSFAKKIAPIRVKASLEDAAIPTLVTFLEIYGVRDVNDLDVWRFWNENKAYEGLKSIVGLRSGAQPFILDISDKAHGPHGLMAGTTGSGKSVMLETYILSLALNYHPDQIRFILIDYKGGGMAETFRKLPHVTGIIDNLQGERVINRALSSIQGEIHRREKIFKDSGVNNIDDYIRFYGDDPNEVKLPHLIIIVDEFAELKNDQPDFMRELVSASRVGRSLGIHLILATQKPSNSVSDEIWANTNFRICLRVQSRGDSMDMLHRPDAAYIKGMGRCYIQIGNDEIFEQVQTSYSGAAYNPNEPNMDENPLLLDDAGQVIRIKKKKKKSNVREKTQMSAVLDRIQETVREHHMTEKHLLWLDELKNMIFLSEIPGYAEACYRDGQWPDGQEGLTVPFAMADDVANQRYLVSTVDLIASRNLMIVGLAGTGKTTLILTLASALASKYDPSRLRMYVMSLSSRTLGCLSTLPHVGEIVYDGELHELNRMLRMLEEEAEARTKRFEAAWTNNFIEYNRSQLLKNQPVEPSIVVFVDRMAQIREMLEADEDMLNLYYDLLREGSSRGIFFVVTSLGGNEVPMKIRDCFQGIALQPRDRGECSDIIGTKVPIDMAPVAPVTGRGMFIVEGAPYEIQVALPADGPSDVERAQALTQMGEEMRASWQGNTAPGIARIPEKPTFDHFAATPRYQSIQENALRFPLAYDLDSGLPMEIDLQNEYSSLIIGGKKSGKTNALMHIARCFAERGAAVYVLGGEEWREFSQQHHIALATALNSEWDAMLDSLMVNYAQPRMKERNNIQNKKQMEKLAASFPPVALIIDNIHQYVDAAGTHFSDQHTRRIANLFSIAQNMGFYTFTSIAAGSMKKCAYLEPVKTIIDQQRGLIIGGKMNDLDPWNVTMPYQLKKVSLPVGTAFYVNGDSFRQVVFPLLIEE